MTEKKKPGNVGNWSIGLMSFAGLGAIAASPAVGVVAMPFMLKVAVCVGCAWSCNETLKKFVTGRIPKRLPIKNPPVVNGWSVFIGRTGGRNVYHNFNRTPHSKVCGLTGAGKSVFLSYLVAALCMNKTTDQLEVWVIDLKDGATFAHFAHFAHVRVVDNIQGACAVLEMVSKTVHERNKQIANARRNFNKPPKFKRLIVLIDEGTEIAPAFSADDSEKVIRSKCMAHLSSIVRLGRECRTNVIYATQRISHDSLPTSIRGQFDATVCFRVENELDAEIALRRKHSAELLPNVPGRFIYKNGGGECEVQAPIVDDETLEKWIKSRGAFDGIDIPFNMIMDDEELPHDGEPEAMTDETDRKTDGSHESAERRDGNESASEMLMLSDVWTD